MGAGSCGACSAQRATDRGSANRDQADASAGRLIDETVRSPGQPLPANVRADMGSRFGFDFKNVRIHADDRAAASSAAIGAGAYTVGNHIAFGAGRWAPDAARGRHLLAHELTHVVQQSRAPHVVQQSPESLSISRPEDASEHEADAVAAAISRGGPAPAIMGGSAAAAVQAGDRDPGTPPPPAPGPSQPAPQPTCGPNVTTQVQNAVTRTRTTFGGWSAATRESQCDALDSLSTGAVAWDIVELHNNAWILGYRPACASQGATPPCGSTVQVGTECFYAGSPNYVIYGAMCKLCHDHYNAAGNASGVARFTQSRMDYWVNVYKGTGFTGLGTPSANFGPSRDWARAGYNGWPSGGSPPGGDRNTCSPTCPTAYAGSAFSVNWVPLGVF